VSEEEVWSRVEKFSAAHLLKNVEPGKFTIAGEMTRAV
jgi:hypothetical protein